MVHADHFTPVNLHEMSVYHMVEAHELTPAQAIKLAFVHDFPEAKGVPLLAILTRTDFETGPHGLYRTRYTDS
jgi:hypothetical protein